MSGPERKTPSPEAQQLIGNLEIPVSLTERVEQVWSRVFTDTDRRKLGGSFAAAYQKYGDTPGLYMQARGVTRARAIVEAGRALGFLNGSGYAWLLREIGEDPQASLCGSIEAGHLVLVEASREAYWEGKKIATDWHSHGRSWDLLWALAERAGEAQPLHWRDLGGSVSASGFSTRKGRLIGGKLIPPSLKALIKPADRETYRLDLPAERIHLVRRGERETPAQAGG